MSVLVFIEHHHGKFSKSSLETVTYGRKLADMAGTDVVALTYGTIEADGKLGNAGAQKVLVNTSVNPVDSQQLTKLALTAIARTNADMIVLSHDALGKLVAPRIAARMNAAMVSGATSVPETAQNFKMKKNVFSGKAVVEVEMKSEKKVITVLPNSLPPLQTGVIAIVENFEAELGESKVKVKEIIRDSGEGVPLPEAEIVVSAGRGMKGPENWGLVEELAKELGGATACSRPVADIGWRPHHEHVGQTGLTVRPNLYIAIGISGAIQHLAGVNGSKVIVVINKDAEAPFFKAADYGIVGDAFEVLPKLLEAAKEFNQHK